MSNIIRFRNRPFAVLNGGVITKDSDPSNVGKFWFFVEYVDEEGDHLGVWDGPSYDEGRAALAAWRQDGVRTIDLLQGAPDALH